MTQDGPLPGDPLSDDDQAALESDRDLTPPHGDELRGEITVGRTDRHANVDDEQAADEAGEGGRR